MRRFIITLAFSILTSHFAYAEGCAKSESLQIKLLASPDGDLDSLPKVVDCIAKLVASKPELKTILVQFAPGTYRQAITATLPKQLGAWSGTLTLEGVTGKTLITGSQPVESFEKDNKLINRYVATVPSWVAKAIRDDLPRDHGLRDAIAPPWLMISGVPLSLSQFPNSGFLDIVDYEDDSPNLIRFAPNIAPKTQSALFIQGFLKYGWADSRRPISKFSTESGLLQIAGPPIKYGIKKAGKFVLRGAPEFIDEDGEFAVGDENLVYFQFNQIPKNVEFTVANKLLEAKAINNLIIDGLSFSGARNTAIDLVGENIAIKNVEVLNSGWIGVRLKGMNNVIDKSVISNTGYSAVEIAGGVRESLTSGNNQLKNSIIQDFGLLVWSSVPGVRVEGVGNSVSNNQITRGPHSGIFYFGNDHIISHNEVSFVARKTDDVGAIYSGRDWAGRGHQVVDNYIHDVHGVGNQGATGLYLDDQVSGILLSRNIIWNVDRGILIGGGRDNTITENIVIKAKQCIRFDDRGLNWQKKEVQPGGSLWNSVAKEQLDHNAAFRKYKGMEGVLTNKVGYPVGNVVNKNILLCPSSIYQEALINSEVSQNWLKGNPGFEQKNLLTQDWLPMWNDFKINWKSIDWSAATQ